MGEYTTLQQLTYIGKKEIIDFKVLWDMLAPRRVSIYITSKSTFG